MAQTKRRRQTKHRGNAAGEIEARGRTSRPPSPDERKRAARAKSRDARGRRAPTWRGAFLRGLLAGAFMFVFLLITEHPKHGGKLVPALIFAAAAICLYVPGGYYLEWYLYRRRVTRDQDASKR